LSDFTLPSGRILQLKEEPTWGDECDADEAGYEAERAGKSWGNARVTALMAIMTGLPTEEVRQLKRSDYRALSAEIRKRMGIEDPEAKKEAEQNFSTQSPRSS